MPNRKRRRDGHVVRIDEPGWYGVRIEMTREGVPEVVLTRIDRPGRDDRARAATAYLRLHRSQA
jgi:hypothetical protein